jgi:tRNA(Ile)-lysidine synthetase-like protein
VTGNKSKAQARLAIPVPSEVVLRPRREGDRIALLGLKGHTQKVGRWMINHKIPKVIRDSIPLLIVNGEVAAICAGETWAISQAFAVEDDDGDCVYFAWEKNEP